MNFNDLYLDEYGGFWWNNHNSKEFNMFIISSNNSSNGVSFFNGPSFSNEYSKPLFEKANSNFLGASFQTQKIKFKVGVYDFTIDMYREIRKWLDEYTVSQLVFDFNQKWGYEVKLANIQDSERYFIGRKKVGENKFEDSYYTEFELEFDVQGEACAISTSKYEIDSAFVDNKVNVLRSIISKNSVSKESTPKKEYKDSFLDTPIVANIAIQGLEKVADCNVVMRAKRREGMSVDKEDPEVVLFNIVLSNLPGETNSMLNLRYDSESGIIFLQFGDSTKKVLSLVSSNVNGQRILTSSLVNKFKIPGGDETDRYYFEIESTVGTKIIYKKQEGEVVTSTNNTTTFEISARTNIL